MPEVCFPLLEEMNVKIHFVTHVSYSPRGGVLAAGAWVLLRQTWVRARETTPPRKSLGQPEILRMFWAHKVRFPGNVVPVPIWISKKIYIYFIIYQVLRCKR